MHQFKVVFHFCKLLGASVFEQPVHDAFLKK